MNILYIAKLTDSKLKEKLAPILQSHYIDHIYVLRDFPGAVFDDRIIYLSPRKPINGPIRHLLKIFKGIYYCHKFDIKAVIGVLNTPHGYIGRVIGFLTGKPYIHVTIAGHREYWVDGKVAEAINCFVFKRAAFVTVTGSQTQQYLLGKGFKKERIVVLPNIPDQSFLDISNVTLPEKREYDLLFMSRIDKNKNLGLLLRAIFKLKDSYHIKTLVVGDGEELEPMQKLAASYGLENSVVFAGLVTGVSNKMAMYNKARIFISCSKGEGFPVSMIEAMSCGCVPIVSNVGDIVDMIDQGVNGFVFNNTDKEDELVRYLETLLSDENRVGEMSLKAQEARYKVSVEKNAKIWDSVFTKIAEKKWN